MDAKTSEIFNGSFERCLAKPGFLPRFYELFLAASPDIREKFKNTDFKRQIHILKKSLYALTLATLGTEEARTEIERLGRLHGRAGLAVERSMYDLWLDCLLRAVREYDIGWTPETERTWRAVFEPHITALKSYS